MVEAAEVEGPLEVGVVVGATVGVTCRLCSEPGRETADCGRGLEDGAVGLCCN